MSPTSIERFCLCPLRALLIIDTEVSLSFEANAVIQFNILYIVDDSFIFPSKSTFSAFGHRLTLITLHLLEIKAL